MSDGIKVALGAYSDFLVRQFTEYPANENISIDLHHFMAEHVMAVVRFIYTGELELSRETVGPIWQVAEGLGVTTVVGLCEDFLGQV